MNSRVVRAITELKKKKTSYLGHSCVVWYFVGALEVGLVSLEPIPYGDALFSLDVGDLGVWSYRNLTCYALLIPVEGLTP